MNQQQLILQIMATTNKVNFEKSEDRIQQEMFMWFHNNHKNLRGLLFAVPNGGYRLPTEREKFKKTGVVSGVSDMIFMFQGKTYCFEVKTPKGYQSKKQKEWQKLVSDHGFYYFIVRDLDTFKYLVNGIVKGQFNLQI